MPRRRPGRFWEPACRGVAGGSVVERVKWRLALSKRLKPDSPLWATIEPALEAPPA